MARRVNRNSPEGLKKRLDSLLKLPENHVCADCPTKQPRWASSKLGVFICIDCSGIHRNLGTHISFVRSVNLDSWTIEQVEKMEQWGNARAKAYFEAEVPPNYQRPLEGADVRAIQRWIRDKYETRRFVPRDGSVPDRSTAPAPVVKQSVQPGASARIAPVKKLADTHVHVAPVSKPAVAPSPAPPAPALDLLDFSEPPAPPAPSAPAAVVPPALGMDPFATQPTQQTLSSDPFGQNAGLWNQTGSQMPQQQQQQQQQLLLQQEQQQQQLLLQQQHQQQHSVTANSIMSMFNAPAQSGMAAQGQHMMSAQMMNTHMMIPQQQQMSMQQQWQQQQNYAPQQNGQMALQPGGMHVMYGQPQQVNTTLMQHFGGNAQGNGNFFGGI